MRNGPSHFEVAMLAAVVAFVTSSAVIFFTETPTSYLHHPTTLASAHLPVRSFNPTYIADVPDVEVTEIEAWSGMGRNKAIVSFANGMICMDGVEMGDGSWIILKLKDHVHLQATVSSFSVTDSNTYVDDCHILETFPPQASS